MRISGVRVYQAILAMETSLLNKATVRYRPEIEVKDKKSPALTLHDNAGESEET